MQVIHSDLTAAGTWALGWAGPGPVEGRSFLVSNTEMMGAVASPHSCTHCHILLETKQHERGRMLLARDAQSAGFVGALSVSMTTGSLGCWGDPEEQGEASHVKGKMQSQIHIKEQGKQGSKINSDSPFVM